MFSSDNFWNFHICCREFTRSAITIRWCYRATVGLSYRLVLCQCCTQDYQAMHQTWYEQSEGGGNGGEERQGGGGGGDCCEHLNKQRLKFTSQLDICEYCLQRINTALDNLDKEFSVLVSIACFFNNCCQISHSMRMVLASCAKQSHQL